MKVLIGAMLLVLISGINCQASDGSPTTMQDQCFENFKTNNPNNPDVQGLEAAGCPSEQMLETDPDAACSIPSCLYALQRIFYGRCNYDLQYACSLNPSAADLLCLIPAFTERGDDLTQTCVQDDVPINLTSSNVFSDVCAVGGACTTLYEEITGTCVSGFKISEVCDFLRGDRQVMPDNPYGPSEMQDQCFEDYLTEKPNDADVQAVVEKCPPVDVIQRVPDTLCVSPCLEAIAKIYNGKCGYDVEYACSLIPDATELACLIDDFTRRGAEVQRVCVQNGAPVDLESENAVVNVCEIGGECSDIYGEIANGCNDDFDIKEVCAFVVGGSVKVYAVPVLVLLLAAVSMLF